jgi:putative tricarboxylic transport membrane protein
MKEKNAGDFWSGVALAALGAYIIFEARAWDYMTPEGPGAGFFPMGYGIAMVLLSAFLVFSNFELKAKPETQKILRALSVWAALAIAVALFKVLGFVISFALFTFFVAAVPYRRRLGVAALTGAGVSIGFYLVFSFALGIELPAGALGF